MNKKELVELVAEKAATKKQAQEIVDTILEGIKKTLKKKEDVAIAGFGTFKVKHTKARMGINPKTKEKIKIAAKKKVVFKASKELKELVK
ncbi:MAG: HU family DNA-binding protein [Candidatus Omnitrophica bacterium]|nr:HU family DNA-binding protein [Candidatus Omnitrophota bacterium]